MIKSKLWFVELYFLSLHNSRIYRTAHQDRKSKKGANFWHFEKSPVLYQK